MKKIFWIIVEVNFDVPIFIDDKNVSEITGFFQTFGCTADTEEIMVNEINSFLAKTEWLNDYHPTIKFDTSIIDPLNVEIEILLDNEINEQITSSPYLNGIWYQSGRTYFYDKNKNEHDCEEGYLINIEINKTNI